MSAEAEYQNDASGDVPAGDSEYKTGLGTGVQDDKAPVEDPIDPEQADSDEQLARDDNEAIDKSNIVEERTRGAKPEGGYSEPDEDDIPNI